MTLEQIVVFEEQWPSIRTRLEIYLAGRGVHGHHREDLIQETATRLVGMWSQVDGSRPLWPLVKTIVLNLMRDAARRGTPEELGGTFHERTAPDAASQALARIELAEVARAMAGLSEAHRAVLLAQIVDDMHLSRGTDADKMLRLRARRRLKRIMEGLSAYLPARLRSADLGTIFGGLKEVAAGSIACAMCLAPLADLPRLRSDVAATPISVDDVQPTLVIGATSWERGVRLAVADGGGFAPRGASSPGFAGDLDRRDGGRSEGPATPVSGSPSSPTNPAHAASTDAPSVPEVPLPGGGPPAPPGPDVPEVDPPERDAPLPEIPELPEPPDLPSPEVDAKL